MKVRVIFWLMAWSMILVGVMWIGPAIGLWSDWPAVWVKSLLSLIPIALMVGLYFSMIKPLSTIAAGMDLLNAQDFASRLVTVGQFDADRIVSVFNGMMDRLKAERLRVKEQNHFLHLLIEASPLGIAILDFDGRITECNTAMLDFLNVPDIGVVKGMYFDEVEGDLASEISKITDGTTATVRLGDTMVFRCSRLSFMESGFHRPFIIVEGLTDEVMKAEKAAYGKVIRLIAHEVNNTMAGVNSLLQTLSDVLEDSDVDPDIMPALDSCRERCDSLGRFITSYANVVKIPDLVLRPTDLNSLLASVFPFMESMVAGRVGLTLIKSSEPVIVDADPVMLEQVLVNVVKNAVESIGDRPDGEIRISVLSAINGIEIADNGPGISSEAAGKLFSPFFSTKRGGQGLGLMFVSEILRRHSCRFSLRTDRGGGKLTRFIISFPYE